MTAAFLRLASLFVLSVLPCCGGSPKSEPRAQTSYGSLEVGKQIPGFGSAHHDSQEPWTSLTIYSVAAENPPVALVEGEKVASARARKMGARVFRIGDGKVAKLFGMKVVHGKPFRYDTSMIVICDEKCDVLGIWTSAGLEDLDMLLEPFEAKRATSAKK